MVKETETNEDAQSNYVNVALADGRFLSKPPPGEEIVISGISGSFPDSKHIYEYMDNLFDKVNMVTPTHRWHLKHTEMPIGSGNIPDVNIYDAGFFGVHQKQAHQFDSMNRLLQEKAIEAIFDAGLHPSDLQNIITGVYIGTCFSETEKTWFKDILLPDGFAWTGVTRSMMAHRISYSLKLKGPAMTIDTACSSSLFAFENAYRALRYGEVDIAIVGGVNLCAHPYVTLQFARLGVLSHDAACKAFDKDGNGYARSEAVGILILQKAKDAKRNYAEIIHAKTNCDGFKEMGITFPSRDAQKLLLSDFYDECQIDPNNLSFLEAHGTGTFVGDPEECAAADEILTKTRKTPLLIGSVKSNIGHSEPASGICSLVKCILAFETGFIPPNINFKEPRAEITAIKEGRLKVVTEKTPLRDEKGLLGISSFGFGGGNCHILLRKNMKAKVNSGIPNDNLPRLVCVSGRTKEAVVTLLNEIKNNKFDAEYIRLLHDVFRKDIQNHIYRGYTIISKSGEVCRFLEFFPVSRTSLYLAFGELNNWFAIGSKLMALPPFCNSIFRIQKHLLDKNINIVDMLLDKSPDRDIYHVLGSVSVQIGIIDLFKLENIKPLNHFGYSFGELLSAYFDGILSLQETIDCALVINEASNNISTLFNSNNRPHQINGRLITNGNPSSSSVENLKTALKTADLSIIKKKLLQNLCCVLPKPKVWKVNASRIKYASAENFFSALVNNVNFGIGSIESSSIVLNIGVVPILEKPDDVKIISLFPQENKNHLVDLLRVLGNLYLNGYNPQLDLLYPHVEYPVSRGTRIISPFVEWKHSRKWYVHVYAREELETAQRGSRIIKVQVKDKDWAYVEGHNIDGRNLFPATAYLYIVWETLAILKEADMEDISVEFECCKFLRATTVPAKGVIQFNLTITSTGNFEIVQGDSPVVSGKIRIIEDEDLHPVIEEPVRFEDPNDLGNLPLKTKDIYKELKLRGYNYRKGFRSITRCNINATKGYIKWNNNWVTFMDNMLQMQILQIDTRLLYVPTYIQKMTIYPKRHMYWLKSYTAEGKTTELPVFCNPSSRNISCGYVQINGLLASSIVRKKDLGIPVLEKYVFVPHSGNFQLEKALRVDLQLLLENSLLYKVKGLELIDEFSPKDSNCLSPIVQSAFEDQPLIKPFLKIYTTFSVDVTIPVEPPKKLNTENDYILVIASKVLERPEIFKEALLALRDNGFIISRESLDVTLPKETNSPVSIVSVYNTATETIVCLRKNNSKISSPLVVNITNDFSWIKTIQNAVKTKKSDNIIIYAEDQPTSGILGLCNCIRREPETSFIRCVFIMDNSIKFDLENPIISKQLQKNLAFNVFNNGTWGSYRHLLIPRTFHRMSQHCFVNSLVRSDLSTLTWIEGPLTVDSHIPSEYELVHINYVALNFRDVMTATGKINVDVITTDRLKQECVQGFEFSGRTTDGTRIMSMQPHGAMATLITSDKYLTFKIPDHITMAEAATIPVVYGTVIYGLLMRNNIKRGESILIHSGTGGVGQAAIRLALHFGWTVFTTVGTKEKRVFLKKTFPELKDSHIGCSRDLSFEQMIKRETKGKGVNAVLNSLAEDKLIASIRCLAKGGRMVEIGKFDMANNTDINMLLFQKEASFDGVMLDMMFLEPPSVKCALRRHLIEGILSGYIKPLNYTLFKYEEPEQAFRYMATGKHMGKVILEVQPENAPLDPYKRFPCMARYLCDAEKTVIIVGGLGGFGLELTDWLIQRGARKVVLTSRNGVVTGYQNLRIRIWCSYGATIHISKADVRTTKGCKELIKEAEALGPVDGIFNLAAVIADAVFENQTPESYKSVFEPKAIATQCLDDVTRKLCPSLRSFVIFTSLVAERGNGGQTNYGMANSVMERICEKRKRDGYAALAIAWGAIGEVGLVAEMQEENIEIEIGGTLQQKIANCLNVLDNFLTQTEAVIVSSMVVAEKRGGADAADNMVDAVINILGVLDLKSISLHATLAELGMDSMTAVEIKQTLEREFEVFLTAKDIRTMTLSRLKEIQEEKIRDTKTNDVEEKVTFGLNMLVTSQIKQSNTSELIIKLPSQAAGLPKSQKIIYFPGIEGHALQFEPVAAQLKANVFSLQYIEELPVTSIQGVCDVLLPLILKEVSKSEPFKIVAYSYGCAFAFEIAHILENRGYTGSIVLIDTSPALIKLVTYGFKLQSVAERETELIGILLGLFLSPQEVSLNLNKIRTCTSWDERLKLGSDMVKSKSTLTYEIQSILVNGIYQRIKLLLSYKQSYSKLKTPVRLIRGKKVDFPGLGDDYELAEALETSPIVDVIDGSHTTILNNEMLANMLNTWILEASVVNQNEVKS